MSKKPKNTKPLPKKPLPGEILQLPNGNVVVGVPEIIITPIAPSPGG